MADITYRGVGNVGFITEPSALFFCPIRFSEVSASDIQTQGIVQIHHNIFFVTSASGYGGFTDGYIDNSCAIFVKLDGNGLSSFILNWTDVKIFKNTFSGVPGSAITFDRSTEVPNYFLNFQIGRNIFQQNIAYTGTEYRLISRRRYDPSLPVQNTTVNLDDITWQNYNIFYVDGLTSGQDGSFFNNIVEISYSDFVAQNLGTILSSWTQTVFPDESRSLATYNRNVLSGAESISEFASNAIGLQILRGWSQGYSARAILNWITAGFKPSNLDANDYGQDYIGAVEFASAAPPAEGFTLGAFRVKTHGYGFGF